MSDTRFEASYTIEDIEAWIGCSDIHGELIWNRSGLYNALCGISAAAFKKKSSQDYDILYGQAGVVLVTIFERLKKNENHQYFGRFNDPEHFFRYFLSSMRGEYFNMSQKNAGTEEYIEEMQTHNPEMNLFEDDWLIFYQADIIESNASELIDAFAEWLSAGRARSLKDHFNTCLELNREHKYIMIVGFLEYNENSDLFLRHFNLQKPDMKYNTYKSNNKRLREQWKKFILSDEGKKLYLKYKEGV